MIFKYTILLTYFIFAYLVCCFQTGDFISNLRGIEIRSIGTGNPGAANFYRKVGPKYGVLVLLLDFLKGILVTIPIHFLPTLSTFDWLILITIFGALCGHYFPLPFNKIGGTGMGLGIGLVFGISPIAAFLSFFPAFIYLILFKKPSIAGVIGVISYLIIILFYFYDLINVISIIVCWICIGIKGWVQYKGDIFK